MYPIAYELTKTTSLTLKPVIYTLMFAGSASFSTPFGYQTNLMVHGPGGYQFHDFVRFGTPMQVNFIHSFLVFSTSTHLFLIKISIGIPTVILCYYIYK